MSKRIRLTDAEETLIRSMAATLLTRGASRSMTDLEKAVLGELDNKIEKRRCNA